MYIGIDLGGTNIAAGIVDKNCNLIKKKSRPTLSDRAYTEIIKDMAELCYELIDECKLTLSDIESIGVGSPSSVDRENGIVVYANNLGWENLHLSDELRRYIDIPIFVENDANAAAYAEYLVNGNGKNSFVMVTLGTGIGGGIIIDQKIYRGFNGAAGELGHFAMVYNGMPCRCGSNGCWEMYASVTALIRQTKEAIEKNPDSLMAKDEKISGRTAFDAAKAGDKTAQAVVDQYIEYIASGITSIINIFVPDILVIGGGISKEGDYLLSPIKEYVQKHVHDKNLPQTELKIATLMNDAGIIGAALASTL